jgi:hypothetical protein
VEKQFESVMTDVGIDAAKTEGMLRYYLEGRLPLAEQSWPACLNEYKAKILGMQLSEPIHRDSYINIDDGNQ